MHMRRTTEHVWVCLVYIRAITMAAAGHTERLRASLAAEEREALEAIKSDLCEWLARPDVLTLDIVPVSFLQALDSGIQLCNVAVLVQNGAKRCMEDGEKLSVRIPMEPLFCNPIKAARGSGMFQANARDNAAKFIQWCRDLGVEEAVIFESVGLVEHTDERRVVLCLLDVARFADKVGIPPPQLVILEKEIAQLERQQISTCRNERNIDPVELHPKTVEEKEGDKKVIVTPEKKATKSDCKAMTGAKNQKESSNEKSDSDREEEEEEPPAKRVKHTKTDKRRVLSPHRQLPATHQSSPPPTYKSVHGANQHSQKRRKSTISSQKPGRKDTVDKKVISIPFHNNIVTFLPHSMYTDDAVCKGVYL